MGESSGLEQYALWLHQRRPAPGHRIPYFARWVQRFLRMATTRPPEPWRDTLRGFPDDLRTPDWQIRQAADAVSLYGGQFRDQADGRAHERESHGIRSVGMQGMSGARSREGVDAVSGCDQGPWPRSTRALPPSVHGVPDWEVAAWERTRSNQHAACGPLGTASLDPIRLGAWRQGGSRGPQTARCRRAGAALGSPASDAPMRALPARHGDRDPGA